MAGRPPIAALVLVLALTACGAPVADTPDGYSVLRDLNPRSAQAGGDAWPGASSTARDDHVADGAEVEPVDPTSPGEEGQAIDSPGVGIDESGPGAPSVPVTNDGPSTTSSASVAMGPGVAEDEIRIGFQVSTDMQAAFAGVGAGGSPPDERQTVHALVAWVNDHGGMAGRRVVPVFHETNPLSGSFASQAQAACATFTEDNEVFAVGSSPVGGSDALVACLSQRQTPLVEQNHWWFDGRLRAAYEGWLYQPGKMRPDRGVAAYVDGLHDAGFFDGTVGLLRFDAPVFTRMTEQVLKPRLAQLGVVIEEEVQVSTPNGVGDFGRMSGELSNAIVRFRSAGVDRLMLLENSAIMSFFFTQQAESQRYRPRYGLSTYNTPTTLSNQAAVEQLRGAVGVGWAPANDVYDAQHPGGNPTWDLCMQIFRDAGLTSGYLPQGYYLMAHCDTVMFLRAALADADALTAGGLRAAVDRLGTSYRSPFGLTTELGPGRHDGASATRTLRYAEACACFEYR